MRLHLRNGNLARCIATTLIIHAFCFVLLLPTAPSFFSSVFGIFASHHAAMARASDLRTGHGEGIEMMPLSSLANGKEMLESVAGIDIEDSLEDQDDTLRATKSTSDDAAGMRRMGKGQQLIRHFRFFSIASFTAIATAAWEIGLFVLTPALVDGGRAGLLYSLIWNMIGFGPIYLSLAEMASMAPIAGAQYHWVSEFAPEGYQRSLSYITG